ncbi:STAS/SEC14 domain-containing protein [Agromyces sp. SYSU T00266]|uniref:STAS/SEC14 domain-containing protein n=1 Tax=Agromyces zhanjiangensis TaxID=3158562 RepID=UPI003395F9A6
MIEMLDGLPEGVIGFRAVGTVTAADYREVLDPAMDHAIERTGKLDFVIVLGDEFDHYSLGAMVEDAKLVGRPLSLWDRAALVTDRDVLIGIAVAFGGLVPGQFRAFPLSHLDDAVAWVGEGAAAAAS